MFIIMKIFGGFSRTAYFIRLIVVYHDQIKFYIQQKEFIGIYMKICAYVKEALSILMVINYLFIVDIGPSYGAKL